MFIAPFINGFPYDLTFTLKYITEVFESSDLIEVYKNSLLSLHLQLFWVQLVAYCSAILSARTSLRWKATIDIISMVTNTVPGMVLGFILFASV